MKKKKIKPEHWIVENDDECERINFDGRFKGVACLFVNYGIKTPFSHWFSSTSHVYPWGQQWTNVMDNMFHYMDINYTKISLKYLQIDLFYLRSFAY
jgi:hypothetical protein